MPDPRVTVGLVPHTDDAFELAEDLPEQLARRFESDNAVREAAYRHRDDARTESAED